MGPQEADASISPPKSASTSAISSATWPPLFRARIELKQIGVRDEAKRLDGVGRCGRQFCSASWLPELRPVNLGVAKDQRLSLNPSQISGACGRLMCCLRYEHEFYVESRKRFPEGGKDRCHGRGRGEGRRERHLQ